MTIHEPGVRLLKHIPLKFVGGKHAHGGKHATNADLNLTSMIDFLTVVVIFLLMSFAASGELATIQQGLQLPDAANTRMLERAPIIAVTKDVITLDVGGSGRRIADVPSLMRESGASGDWRIENLVQDLETLKRNWSMIHPREPFPAAVVLQADRSIDFRVLKKVMYSCAQAGYANISFLVNKAAARGSGTSGE
jgi:biopolymer transport protein ExbD